MRGRLWFRVSPMTERRPAIQDQMRKKQSRSLEDTL